jgi:DNA-binding YbaB/EbfC family protein
MQMTDNNNQLPNMGDLNFDELMKQAQEMQDKMKQAQDTIVGLKVVGEAGGGAVKIIMNGRHDALRVSINDAMKAGDKEVLEDTIAAAINDAVRKIEDETRNKMMEFAQSLQLPPGFKLPF